MVRLMALMCEIKSMNELTRGFNTEEAIENIAKICGLELEEIPHCDTINDVLKNIKVEENITKQDCEIKAFKRLAKKIKKE